MVTSSFTWYPCIPVYHSKDLVNWELIGHGISHPGIMNFNKLNDNDGIWAVTIRYHDGIFYLITTASKSGGNFYITATDPCGPWSDPVWLKDAPGIDPSLFWDDDGKCYYTGNTWDFKKSWPSQCAVWMQELDLLAGKLVGERKVLTYGHANNATFAEGSHLYKINGKYLLLMAEGGASYHHAVTVHHSNSLWGPYIADKTNPVLTHRHLGANYPIQDVGHADLVQTQNGEWYSVALGVRKVNGYNPLARETFLCKVEFENGTPIYNPGYGIVLPEQKRPDLPWTPFTSQPAKDNFESEYLASKWYFVRTPQKQFYNLDKGCLNLSLQPEVIDSLVNATMVIQKIKHLNFTAMTKLNFHTGKENETAGLVVYRTADCYYSLMKDKLGIVLIKKYLGEKEIIKRIPYSKPNVFLRAQAKGLDINFSFGETTSQMSNIGGTQSLKVISDNKFNKFNGSGIGVYATSNGRPSKNRASYDWFEYNYDK
jgi:Beta-xylosidase